MATLLPFNAVVFLAQFPELAINKLTNTAWSVEELTNIWNNEALILGGKVLSLFNNIIPTDSVTGIISTWNATTNTPTLSNNVPQIGISYVCTTAGSVNFGAGSIIFNVYDIVNFNSLFMQWMNIGQPLNYYWASIIMAHIIFLYNRQIVGRLNQATEGDVTGQFTYQDTLSNVWWNQSTYGARVWKLLMQRGGFTAFVNIPYTGIFYQGNNNVYQN